MSTITSYSELFDLPDKTVVQDADGRIWCVQHHPNDEAWRRGVSAPPEVWLSPFSDEYCYTIQRDGDNHAHGDTPKLPIENLGIVDAVGG